MVIFGVCFVYKITLMVIVAMKIKEYAQLTESLQYFNVMEY